MCVFFVYFLESSNTVKGRRMNPHDWSHVKRLQIRQEPDQQRVLMSSSVPRLTGDWDTFPVHPAVQLQSRSAAWREPSPPDLDGKPLEQDDPELIRKKRQLQELHDQIMQKKAKIAFKAIEITGTNPSEPDVLDGKELATCNPGTLRDRVTEILQQRSFSFFSKVINIKWISGNRYSALCRDG